MRNRKVTSPNLGTPKSPIDFGDGTAAYRRNGRWHYRNLKTMRKFGRRFLEATDQELILELATRGYQILYPAHECVDRPNLPCPGCEMAAQQAVRVA